MAQKYTYAQDYPPPFPDDATLKSYGFVAGDMYGDDGATKWMVVKPGVDALPPFFSRRHTIT